MDAVQSITQNIISPPPPINSMYSKPPGESSHHKQGPLTPPSFSLLPSLVNSEDTKLENRYQRFKNRLFPASIRLLNRHLMWSGCIPIYKSTLLRTLHFLNLHFLHSCNAITCTLFPYSSCTNGCTHVWYVSTQYDLC